jgi:hypothetical protein
VAPEEMDELLPKMVSGELVDRVLPDTEEIS